MNNLEYAQARKELGFNVADWIEQLGISHDSHKSFNCGRVEVPVYVANHIGTMRELQRLKNKRLNT